jgi:hypothetical protein
MTRRSLLPARTAPALRRAALLVLLAFLPTACSFWRTVPVTQLERGEEKVEGVEVRFFQQGDPRRWHLVVEKVDLPFIEGTGWSDPAGATVAQMMVHSLDGRNATPLPETRAAAPRAPIRVDVRTLFDVQVFSPGRAVLYTLGAVALSAVLLALLVVLTKTSCPFVYVDGPDGPVFAGEAYSGATSKAIQRDDLLPLPLLAGPTARLRLSNEARETQLTDRLELVLVDHDPALRALSTPSARPVLVGAATAPIEVRDLEGADVTPLVRADDGLVWSSDLDAAASRATPPSREGLVASFAAPPAGTPPVLELRVGNTPFLDVVFSRFYALAGDRLGELQELGADPKRAAEINDWRLREGVDLLVETWRAGRWERAAVVSTPGPASLRTVAVVLPAFEPGAEARVRVSGGIGFWTIDRIGLSALRDQAPAVVRLAPATAQDAAGDARPLLAATDGRHHVLPDAGAVLSLTFDLPSPPAGQVRDAFLDTSGYYLLHRPPQAERALATLDRVWKEPGALSRFSLDLYRGFRQALASAPPVAP